MSKVVDYINNNLDIGEEFQEIFGRPLPKGKFFCVFHDNKNTPSAKRYGNGIKCFGLCQRYYTVYDLLKRFNPQRIEDIKSTIILPESSFTRTSKEGLVSFDRNLPISQIIKIILDENRT